MRQIDTNARLSSEVERIVATLLRIYWVIRLQGIDPFSQCFRKLYIDFLRHPSITRNLANEKDNEVRRLFTDIGCIMEDASLIALVWKKEDQREVAVRFRQIAEPHTKIGELLSRIDGLT